MTATTTSFPRVERFRRRIRLLTRLLIGVISAQPGELDEHADEEDQGDRAQHQRGLQVALLLFWRDHAYFTSGGVSKVWNGAGLGTVHSRPSAPSHGLASAFWPPRMVGITTKNRKNTWLRPKPKAPTDTIWLKSVNCTA